MDLSRSFQWVSNCLLTLGTNRPKMVLLATEVSSQLGGMNVESHGSLKYSHVSETNSIDEEETGPPKFAG